ncbi:hypothetical protein BHE74_00054945 [Ensete ventricosum]|nr:hypothetical protein BHE74_00054945 [Ensete ventricosum]
MVSRKNSTVINFALITRRVEFRSIFGAPSRKFKILANPEVFILGKSYEDGFVKILNSNKLCTKSHAESSIDRFSVHRLKNSKYWPFPTY